MLHLPPFPSLWPLLSPDGVGPRLRCGALRAGGGGALLQLQCHVWMLPQWEIGTGARRTLETARRTAPSIPPQGASHPSPASAPGLGWVPVSARQEHRTLRPTLRRLQSAGSEPARELALEWGKGRRENYMKEDGFYPVLCIPPLPAARLVTLQGEQVLSLEYKLHLALRHALNLDHLLTWSKPGLPLTQNLSQTPPDPFLFFPNVRGEGVS